MTAVHDEGTLRFSFDDDWRVLRWDGHPAYTAGLGRTQGTKAVDFVAVHVDAPWFIEVKDFRGHRIANKERLTGGELALEVAEKVRDTLASLTWACRRPPLDGGELAVYLGRIVGRERKVPVMLWLEEDRPVGESQASVLQETIKQHLPWLNARVLVVSRSTAHRQPIPGLDVVSLPRPAS